ncbi:MAG: hypothetical protein GY858_02020 [Candidatus Omnitrophica bacterium]|nr:hypothetical protein [Candidatus Omnitrophota bacterium]
MEKFKLSLDSPRVFCSFFIGLVIFFLLLPEFLKVNFQNDFAITYHVIWRNFLGANYKLSIEIPKPLMVLLHGLLSPKFAYFISVFFSALWVAVSMKLSKRIVGNYLNGFFAAILMFTASREIIWSFFIFVRWPIVYVPLVFLQILLFLAKRYSLCFFVNFLTCLIRPESWFYAPIFIFFIWRDKGKMKLIYFLPFLAPVVWAFFDYRISGDPLYSYNILKYYINVLLVEFTSFSAYWRVLAQETFSRYNFVMIFLGCGLLLVTSKLRGHFKQKTLLPVIMVSFPLLLYWGLALKGDLVVVSRYFCLPLNIIVFYASLIVMFAFGDLPYRKYLNFAYLVLLIALSFNVTHFNWAKEKVRNEENVSRAIEEAVEFLLKNQQYIKNCKAISAPFRKDDYLSYLLGEKKSQKIKSIGKVNFDYLNDNLETPLIIIDCNNRYRNFIDEVISSGYTEQSIYMSSNGLGVVYKIQ